MQTNAIIRDIMYCLHIQLYSYTINARWYYYKILCCTIINGACIINKLKVMLITLCIIWVPHR